MATKTRDAITETGEPTADRGQPNVAESLSEVRDRQEERAKEMIAQVRSGEVVAETSNQRAPTEEDKARLAGDLDGTHDGFVRPGDTSALGTAATSAFGAVLDAPAKEWQVTQEVLDSPTFRAMDPDSQRHIDSLLMRHPAIVKNDVLAVPLEDPGFKAEQVLSAGFPVPEGLGWVPANYVDRKRRIALA